MAKRMHVLRMHMLHNRPWEQMNNIMRKQTVQRIHNSLEAQPSLQSVTPLINRCRWSVGQGSPSRCALCPCDRPNWKSKCDTRPAAETPNPPYSAVNQVQTQAVGGR